VDFIINAILFVLIGLQLHAIINSLSGIAREHARGLCPRGRRRGHRHPVAVVLHHPLHRLGDRRRPEQRARDVGPGGRLVAAWSGLRGAVSLAVALAIPITTQDGDAFPKRNLIIFLTFAVIFFTLVAQGLSLPALIRRLAVSDDGADTDEDIRARLVAAKAAVRELDELATEDWTRDQTIERLRRFYEYRKSRFAARAGKIDDDGYEDQTLAYQNTLRRLLAAQRDALIQMRTDASSRTKP
jgi:hypothetical protein